MIDHPFVRCRARPGLPCLSELAGKVSSADRCHYWPGIGPYCNLTAGLHTNRVCTANGEKHVFEGALGICRCGARLTDPRASLKIQVYAIEGEPFEITEEDYEYLKKRAADAATIEGSYDNADGTSTLVQRELNEERGLVELQLKNRRYFGSGCVPRKDD